MMMQLKAKPAIVQPLGNQHESYLWFSAEKPPLVRELRDYSGRLSARSGPSRESSHGQLQPPVPPRFVVSWRLSRVLRG